MRLTCVDPLPAHGEGGPGLDEVADDGAAVVAAAAPGQLGGAVGHLLHRHRVGRARRAWHSLERGKGRGDYHHVEKNILLLAGVEGQQVIPCSLHNSKCTVVCIAFNVESHLDF